MPRLSSRSANARAQQPLALLVSLVLLVVTLATSAQAAVGDPALRLMGPSGEVTMWRYGRGEPVYLDLGVLVGSEGAAFELLVQRPDYTKPPTLTQVIHRPGPTPELRALDPALLDGWRGLADFFEVSFVKDAAEVVSTTHSFCPGSYQRERLNDSGPDVPIYPTGCYSNPFTKGVVWGIDEGWAVGSSGDFEPPSLDIPNGRYAVSVNIAPVYVDLFEIDPAIATVRFPVRVRTMRDFGCERGCEFAARSQVPTDQQSQSVPTDESPDLATLPDLIALPSWGIRVANRRERAMLTFGATVWNGGAADLVVEGFRRSDEAVMDGFQYFYDRGEVVGKAPTGELEFDARDGHTHWHFKQFAAYSLLDVQGNEVRKSRKEAFCLVPTDAIDLTLPNVDWNPGAIGLHTACGGQSSIWVREILPLGWGDTYFQGIPGQSFWITKLPNGTYFIKIEANPGGLLYETTDQNNVELREIQIKGRPGHRRVVVPPWNGIDTEGPMGAHGGEHRG